MASIADQLEERAAQYAEIARCMRVVAEVYRREDHTKATEALPQKLRAALRLRGEVVPAPVNGHAAQPGALSPIMIAITTALGRIEGPATAEAIKRAIPDHKRSTIGSALVRGAAAGRFVRLERGAYTLPPASAGPPTMENEAARRGLRSDLARRIFAIVATQPGIPLGQIRAQLGATAPKGKKLVTMMGNMLRRQMVREGVGYAVKPEAADAAPAPVRATKRPPIAPMPRRRKGAANTVAVMSELGAEPMAPAELIAAVRKRSHLSHDVAQAMVRGAIPIMIRRGYIKGEQGKYLKLKDYQP